MVEKNQRLFEEINSLYDYYVVLSSKENVESMILSVREKILIAVYKIYVPTVESEGESYADEIIGAVDRCLSSFENPPSKDVTFSRYVCTSIRRRISALREKDALESKNAGMNVSSDAYKKIKKIKDLDGYYAKFGCTDEKIRNGKIAASLEMSVEDVERYKEILNGKTIAQNQKDEDGREYDAVENFLKDDFFPAPEKNYELKEKCLSLFSAIKSEVKKRNEEKPDETAFFKTLLTVDLLRKHFPQKRPDRNDGKDGRFLEERNVADENPDFIFNREKLFREAEFLDSEIVARVFSNENYTLPEMHLLAEKADLSKSGLSKMLSRFYEKIIRDYECTWNEREFAEFFLKM